MIITDDDIELSEKTLLPSGCAFTKEQIELIKCLDSTEIIACPGSGKTTLLLAKLLCVANHFPLANNSGICVLSHTNVAINEIQHKFGKKMVELNSYPHFIGTVQSFIDKYIVFPYLTQFTSESISVLDQESYSSILWKTANRSYTKYGAFFSFISNRVNALMHISDPIEYIKDLKLDSNRNLFYKEKIIAKQDSRSAKQFADLKNYLLKKGITNFNDTYIIANKVSKLFKEELRTIVSKRFSFVFIDEYQDCDEQQRNILNFIFDDSIVTVQKIGDVDQAIFSNQSDDSSIWVAKSNALHMRGTNRYSQKIADEVVKLRTNKENIDSLVPGKSISPCLIIFNQETIDEVVPTFVNIIHETEILKTNSPYPIKAIGMIKNSKGLKISDYWKKFKLKSDNTSNGNSFLTYLELIKEELMNGNIAGVHIYMVNIFNKLFILCDKRTVDEGLYNVFNIKTYLLEEQGAYQDFLLSLITINFNSIDLNEHIIGYIREVLNEEEFKNEKVQNYLNSNEINKNDENIDYIDDSMKITFETVHKTKGETHLATLYLETETKKTSDIKRILPLLNDKKIAKETNLHKRTRKIVYVGFSRPSKLLCLAIQKSTYEKSENAFNNWTIYNCCEEKNKCGNIHTVNDK